MVLDGEFGALMQVHIQNDGPVTIELTSPSAPTDSRLVCLIPAVSWFISLMSRFSQNCSPQIMLHYFTLHLFNNVTVMVFNMERWMGDPVNLIFIWFQNIF